MRVQRCDRPSTGQATRARKGGMVGTAAISAPRPVPPPCPAAAAAAGCRRCDPRASLGALGSICRAVSGSAKVMAIALWRSMMTTTAPPHPPCRMGPRLPNRATVRQTAMSASKNTVALMPKAAGAASGSHPRSRSAPPRRNATELAQGDRRDVLRPDHRRAGVPPAAEAAVAVALPAGSGGSAAWCPPCLLTFLHGRGSRCQLATGVIVPDQADPVTGVVRGVDVGGIGCPCRDFLIARVRGGDTDAAAHMVDGGDV